MLDYGDPWDQMGGEGHYSVLFKEALSWVDPAEIVQISSSGTYAIHPLENATSKVKGLRIPVPSRPDVTYYLDYRQPIGYDDRYTYELQANVYTGVVIRLDGNPSQLLDMRGRAFG